MRYIERIFVHCTATSQALTIDGLRKIFKEKKWKHPGYHYVVMPNGDIEQMLDEDLVSNGVKGYNMTSINVAYMGGISGGGRAVDNRTPFQKASLVKLLTKLKRKYPKAKIMGHRDISPDVNGNGRVDSWERIKECPCFDAIKEYAGITGRWTAGGCVSGEGLIPRGESRDTTDSTGDGDREFVAK